MIVVNRSRRQFLVGTGGFTLALPFLPSLFPSKAEAQAYTAKPRFVAMGTHHGACWGRNMFPDPSTATETTNLYSDHQIKRGALKATVNGSTASLCPVLSASSTVLTNQMVSKMNVLRGVDVAFYLSHNTGGHLGNYARSDRQYNEGDYVSKVGGPIQTIDQLLAYSSSFYSDVSSIRERTLNIGTDGGLSISWGYANPQAKSGDIQSVPSANSSLQLFNSIFVAPQTTTTPASTRKPVVDQVMESYKRLKAGTFGDAKRLSAADKQRLDDHMTRISELQRRLNTAASASCGSISKPSDNVYKGLRDNDLDGTIHFYKLFNDVIVAAFICGTSRIATIYSDQLWSTYAGDWHQEVAHQANQPDGVKQALVVAAYQSFFENCFLDLASKLDVEEANGKTYLDSTLVQWTQESGQSTHDPLSIPIITAGSANGFFKTGYLLDYRNKNAPSLGHTDEIPWQDLQVGILYNQWLATVLQAMGVPPSEYEMNGKPGYGSIFTETYYGKGLWPQRLFDDASKVMPLMKA
ncbi:MAG TPA: DUF1552 domain-containing protein [Polyangiaceae bacterium]|nr:DUF1552 domain-containing protein [Polyangiaceae bacterium]